jgi:hypothetical protein
VTDLTDISLRLSLQPVLAGDFEDMLALRIDAMRPSLERVGRFDLETDDRGHIAGRRLAFEDIRKPVDEIQFL